MAVITDKLGGQWKTVVLCVIFAVQLSWLFAKANPCTDESHSCDASTQTCHERNNSAGFSCECIQPDRQLDENQTCVVIPESQRLYLTTPINTSGADVAAVFKLLNTPEVTKATVINLFRSVTLSTFKTAVFVEFKVGPVVDLRIVLYYVIFTEDITGEMREAIGSAVLEMEAAGSITTADGSVTVAIAGPTGIFDTKHNADNKADDDMDWCAFPSLYSCRNHSTCHDVDRRYVCPCNSGYLDDGTVCFECTDEFLFGPGCGQQCDCDFNTTESCDRIYGTCYCRAGWEGVSCENDVDECSSPNANNCSSVHSECENTVGGYQCVCKPSAAQDETGTCTGPVILGSTGFETDGSRDLHLVCDPGNVLELSSITWDTTCLRQQDRVCTIRPQPPWDDGKVITCTATYADGQSSSAAFVIDLMYPPESAPIIEGYQEGQALKTGGKVKMVCSVSGGKPLVMSVNFFCPGHPDNDLDLVSETVVRSVLEIDPLAAADDGSLCVCSATWKNRLWYTLSASRILSVTESSNPDENPISEKFIIIVAAVAGGVVIVFIVVVIIVWKIRGSARNVLATSVQERTFSANAQTDDIPETNSSPNAPPQRHNVHNMASLEGISSSGIYEQIVHPVDPEESLYIHPINNPSGETRSVPWKDLQTNPVPHPRDDFGVRWQRGWNRDRFQAYRYPGADAY